MTTEAASTAAPLASGSAVNATPSNVATDGVGSSAASGASTAGIFGAVSSGASTANADTATTSHGVASGIGTMPPSGASGTVIGSAVPSMGAGAMFQAVFGLAVVIALVFACGWVARRLGLKPSMRRGGLVKVVGSATLGARERVVVVEIRDTWLVLGVAAGNVRRLHTLPAQAPRDTSGPDDAGANGDVSQDAPGGASDGSNATPATTVHAADAKSSDTLPSFQTAFARQLKDRLHGLGRSGNPGGKD